MNTFKRFLVLGSALVCITSYNIASSSQCHSINKSGLINGAMELSNCNTIITKSLEVRNSAFGKENHNKLAEVRFGKKDKSPNKPNTHVILENNGELIQNTNGHIHVFNSMDVREGANIFTTKYNPNHIEIEGNKKSIKDYNLRDKDTAGFDIHGNKNVPNSGFVKFYGGSNIFLSGNKTYIKTGTQGVNSYSNVTSTTTANGQVISQYNHRTSTSNSCTCCSCCCCVENHTEYESGHCHGQGYISEQTNSQTSGQTNNTISGQTSGETQGQISGSTNTGNSTNGIPVLYLCNAYSRVDISEVLKKTYKSSDSEDEIIQNFKVRIVGTTDEYCNRQGTVDIFDINSSKTTSDSIFGNIDKQLDNIGNNDVICENVKISIPSYNIQVIGDNGSIVDNNSQTLTVTALEPAVNNGTEEKPVYNTINGTDEITGVTIHLVDSQGNNVAKFIQDNLTEILKDSYLDNSNEQYTLLKKKETEGNGTGIKIMPPINENNLKKLFDTNSNIKIINLKVDQTEQRIRIPEFIKSIRSSNDNNLKLDIYRKSNNNEYTIHKDFLNDQKYTLDLDKFNGINNDFSTAPLVPFNLLKPDLNNLYLDINGEYNSDTLSLYVNLKGKMNKRFKMPTNSENNNKINVLQLLGNNTMFTGIIDIKENKVSYKSDTYVKRILFGNKSYVKTNRISNTTPICWKFIGSNDSVYQKQSEKYYASNIKNSLSLMVLDNSNNREPLSVTVNNPNNTKSSINGGFNSYIYVDEIFFTHKTDNNGSMNHKTSLIVSDNSTIRLVNKEYAKRNPNIEYYDSQVIQISHVDSNFSLRKYNEGLDSKIKYYPMEKFLEPGHDLSTQLQKYANSGHVEFHFNIDKNDFPELNNKFQNLSFLLDIIVQKDESDGKNKMQFYNMMEYVYCSEFNNQSNSSININLENKPHFYIPLLLKRTNNSCDNYYYLTSFTVFPEYTRDLLKENFKNAVNSDLSVYDIIPNIYIGGEKISTKDNDNINICFNQENNKALDKEYLVFKKTSQQ